MTEDRAKRLAEFADWVDEHITGDEKGQAQIYLDRLFQAFGHKGCLEVGGTPEFRIRKGRAEGGGIAFADYVWKPYVLIEMKKRGADLSRHHRQAFDYWVQLVPGRPRYVVLCNFDEFWVYDFETQMDDPVDQLLLPELPTRFGPLAFLFPSHDRPTFRNDHEAVTRDAADKLARCFNKLIIRKVDRNLAQSFTLQTLVALFAEDIGLLERYFVAQLLQDCKGPTDSYDLVGGLFEAMNSPIAATGGRYKGVDYFNGGLFEQPARVELHEDELHLLRQAAEANWSQVRPEIFGTLFEHSLEKEERHAYGGHFTHPADIMKIVGPTIVEPWRSLIANASSLKELGSLRDRMMRYRVLDPACGSGNFLYIAYRELKRLEVRLAQRIGELSKREIKGQRHFGYVKASQFFGIDINPFAVEIAKVTMMIARKLAIDELHVDEPPLPLDNLDDNYIAGDALITPFTDTGDEVPTMLFAELEENPWATSRVVRTKWPKADVIIGNPPFLGAKRLKPERGSDYVNALRAKYPEVPGMADYCVYWFRRAHDLLPPCTPGDPVAGRAGLVGTQNVRNNKSREGGLDHIVETGTIVEAVDNQPWSGEANVHVSIVNWVKHSNPNCTRKETAELLDLTDLLLPDQRKLWHKVDPPPERRTIRKRGDMPAAKEYEIAFRKCAFINSALSDETDVSKKRTLRCNKKPKRCFQGKIPGYSGFLLDAPGLGQVGGTSEVVVPYLTGRELLDEFHIERWAIDFGARSMPDAAKHAGPFAHVRAEVLPAVKAAIEEARTTGSDMVAARAEHLNRWWQFWNRRDELSNVLTKLFRYVACSRVTRRPIIVFLSSKICPSDLIQVFAFEDDYSFGVLQSSLHFEWFKTSSRLKVETDIRYSVRAVFETFPWPQHPPPDTVRAVATTARELRLLRQELLQDGGGLRDIYRLLELPGRHDLKDAHLALDAAVTQAYAFNTKEPPLRQLLDLNRFVSDAENRGSPVTSPGIPNEYPTPQDLRSDDCIEAQS